MTRRWILPDGFRARARAPSKSGLWWRFPDCQRFRVGDERNDGADLHLSHHDVALVAISRAPLSDLEAYKNRKSWRFKWVSSYESDFNFDYHVSLTEEDLAKGEVYYNYEIVPASIEELSGISVFYKDENSDVFHTYSSYGRGNEEVLGAYMYLDLTPKGRNETGPNHNMTDWVRHHDRYGAGGFVDRTGGYIAAKEAESLLPLGQGRRREREDCLKEDSWPGNVGGALETHGGAPFTNGQCFV